MSTWFVTFHGGDDTHAFNNIHVYTTDGDEADPDKALKKDDDVELNEVRGFTTDAAGNLYVVNAHKSLSQILLYAPPSSSSGKYTFQRVFAHKGLSHPFDAVFGPDGDLYVASQDSNAVTVYVGPDSADPDGQGPGTFKGTFISGVGRLRGIACDGKTWYAADADANAVRMYNLDGDQMSTSIAIQEPIHLLYDGSRYLYIGSGDGGSVLVYDTQNPGEASDNQFAPSTYISGGDPAIDQTAGLAFGNDGCFYVASRKGKQILKYPINDTTPPTADAGQVSVFLDDLKDNPEFLTLMP